MKSVLCFGDSNTWGWIPGVDGGRMAHVVRWPGVLQAALGERVRVIEEALNGRMTVWDDPFDAEDKSGKRHLPVALASHAPIDLVVLMLGTNDLKSHLHLSARDIAFGAGVLVDMIRASSAGPGGVAPLVLLVSPAELAEGKCPFAHLFDDGLEKSREFKGLYAAIAGERGVAFLAGSDHAKSSPVDCIHLGAEDHASLGAAVAARVRELLG